MTLREYEAHYAIWAVWGSPLIHGADLRTVQQRHPACLDLMKNPELLAVNQDPLMAPASLLYSVNNGTTTDGDAIDDDDDDDDDVNSTQIVQQAWFRPLSPTTSLANTRVPPRHQQRRRKEQHDHTTQQQGGGSKRVALVLFNRAETAANMSANFANMGLRPDLPGDVRDVLRRESRGAVHGGVFTAQVEPHGAVFVVITQG